MCVLVGACVYVRMMEPRGRSPDQRPSQSHSNDTKEEETPPARRLCVCSTPRIIPKWPQRSDMSTTRRRTSCGPAGWPRLLASAAGEAYVIRVPPSSLLVRDHWWRATSTQKVRWLKTGQWADSPRLVQEKSGLSAARLRQMQVASTVQAQDADGGGRARW